jgi:hypothetical protein
VQLILYLDIRKITKNGIHLVNELRYTPTLTSGQQNRQLPPVGSGRLSHVPELGRVDTNPRIHVRNLIATHLPDHFGDSLCNAFGQFKPRSFRKRERDVKDSLIFLRDKRHLYRSGCDNREREDDCHDKKHNAFSI